MRTRLTALMLGLFLSVLLLGCNKKQQSTDTNSTDSNSMAANAPAPDNNAAPAPPVKVETPRMEKPAPPSPLVVPAGTTLTITTASALGSKISQSGQSFSGTLSNSVTVNGATAIPAGANVTGTVVDAKALGRFAGGASLQLQLTSISIRGVDTAIQTSSVTDAQKGKGKRTAVMAGGGAALGALIGGLAGGGKGAAIGAVAGGGAGTGGAAFTGNKDILLPAESALSFKLEQPLTVRR
jgi:glucose/arabinose dehydrogenase